MVKHHHSKLSALQPLALNPKEPACLNISISSKTPEQLVGLGFRYWMAGYQQNNFDYWTSSWDFFTKELGASTARSVVTELACWVQEIHRIADRKILISEKKAPEFCRDECMAISLIAACQNDICPALRACAQALIGDCEIETVVTASQGFAFKLSDHDIYLKGIGKDQNSFTILNDNSPAY